jgi:hypothetical protein
MQVAEAPDKEILRQLAQEELVVEVRVVQKLAVLQQAGLADLAEVAVEALKIRLLLLLVHPAVLVLLF